MILNDNSVTTQDIKIKCFKFNLNSNGGHFLYYWWLFQGTQTFEQ